MSKQSQHVFSVSLLFVSVSLAPLHRELDHNDISGTIEDTSGAFAGLDSLRKL